ncbi:MAG TPA: hypothetical protein VMV19_09480 [Xanthobacteraceae bacterium]|nr:hypothetical protein [Xanthobacteraceae bacterium]
MAISGVSTAAAYAASQPIGQHKHGKHHAGSISDVDAQSSSIASAGSSSGQLGGKVNISV